MESNAAIPTDALVIVSDILTALVMSAIGVFLFIKARYLYPKHDSASGFVAWLAAYLVVGAWTRVSEMIGNGADQVISTISAIFALVVAYKLIRLQLITGVRERLIKRIRCVARWR